MSRFSRINTIWRKELSDTLRDRRTLIAMVLVPMALYPAMILGSLQGFELQISRLKQEKYKVAVPSDETGRWLRMVIDTDPVRRPGAAGLPAEVIAEKDEAGELPAEEETPPTELAEPTEVAQTDVRRQPPAYEVLVLSDPNMMAPAVMMGEAHVGVLVKPALPDEESLDAFQARILMDQTDIRSQIAAAGLQSILERKAAFMLKGRLDRMELDPNFVAPLEVIQEPTAPPEKVGGSILGQIVPLILIVMTITGAIYPAIDLTAGERERGTLETLMVAPVPTVDLIAGKFVVVALIGMLSAALNLLSIGGTVYLGGLGDVLAQGGEVVIPLGALPWVLLVLVPLAVMFSAVLLAVCSFARSFKEAQNYVMPVMIAALIPAVIGILPGTRLEGPLLVMPVTNIVVLTRDLFMGKFEPAAIVWVTMSSTLYAGAAVAVAARLFGQEAVLFADTGSVKTLFQRRFFKPSDEPTAAQAFLLLALVFSLNFFTQNQLARVPGVAGTMKFWYAFAAVLFTLFVLLPIGLGLYTRVRIPTALSLRPPPVAGIVAALCIGSATWVLAHAWFAFQRMWLTMPREMEIAFEQMISVLGDANPLVMVFFAGIIPAVCEEVFFRGFALSGLRRGVGAVGAVAITAIAFAVFHGTVHRLIITFALGVLFGLLVIRYRSLWPAMIAHLLHNSLALLTQREDALQPVVQRLGYAIGEEAVPPAAWLGVASALVLIGVFLAIFVPARGEPLENAAPIGDIEPMSRAAES